MIKKIDILPKTKWHKNESGKKFKFVEEFIEKTSVKRVFIPRYQNGMKKEDYEEIFKPLIYKMA